MSHTFRPTWAEINLDHVKANYNNIRKLLKPETKFCAVIKGMLMDMELCSMQRF